MQVLSKTKGAQLVGMRYTPLFDCFAQLKTSAQAGSSSDPQGAFRVVSDAYVTSDSGTGVVHQAPGFGEDDMRVCLAHGKLFMPV